MKVAVIGVGYWGKKHVAEYKNLGLKDIIAVDLLDGNLDFCKRNFNVETANGTDAIINDASINAVSICTPNQTHYDICKKMLQAGKNVLLEKPMTLNSREADDLIKLSEEQNKVLCVGHIFRHNNSIKKLKEVIESKTLGEIYSINITWNNLEPIWEDRDILFDLGVHPLDIILYLFGKSPNKVFCNGRGFRQKNNELALINYTIDNVFVNIDISWITLPKERKMVIVGSEKTAFVDCLKQSITVMDNSNKLSTEVPIVANNTIKDELNYFLNCVKNTTKPDMDGRIGKEIVRIIELSNKSLAENREIEL